MNFNTLYYNKPAKYWTQAIPLGNGSMGAVCYSGVKQDKISLNLDTLWTGHPREVTLDGAYESYKKAQALALGRKYKQAQRELESNFLSCWSQAYMPLGDLIIDFDIEDYDSYSRTLDLKNAVL